MKLYFYFLERGYIRQEECEVLEKPKTYYPTDGFPMGFYGCFVHKEDIGKVTDYINCYVILLENDREKAAKIFIGLCKRKIEHHNNKIKCAYDGIKEQESLINIIDEWKNN